MALGYMLAELAVFLFKAIKLRYVRAVFTGLTAAYFTIICICANAQAATWLNTGTLFDNQIRNYPGRIAQAYATRGLYFYGKGLVKKAERDLCEALVIEPHSSLASFSLAGIRKEQKKYDEAIKLYLKVSLLDPNVTMAYSYLSDIYAALGDEKRALFYIEKALKNKEHPTYVFAFFNAGSFYEKRQDYDKAIEYFLKIKPFFPQDYKVYLKIGAIYEKKGDFESAMQNYIEGFEKSDKKEDILRAAARLCFNERIYGKSESLFKLILLENPGDYSAYDYLGSISALKNDYKKALAFFTMALLIKNDLAESYLHRAIVHLDNKMYYKAKDDFLSASRFGIEIPGFLKDELKENSGIVI
jgi:tetratricopeptide (TPR) repeat protein